MIIFLIVIALGLIIVWVKSSEKKAIASNTAEAAAFIEKVKKASGKYISSEALVTMKNEGSSAFKYFTNSPQRIKAYPVPRLFLLEYSNLEKNAKKWNENLQVKEAKRENFLSNMNAAEAFLKKIEILRRKHIEQDVVSAIINEGRPIYRYFTEEAPENKPLPTAKRFLDAYSNIETNVIKWNANIIKNEEAQALIETNIKEATDFLSAAKAVRKDYINRDKAKELINAGKKIYTYINRNIWVIEKSPLLKEFYALFNSIESKIREWNEMFVRNEMQTQKLFFSNINGKAMDDQQRRAVITDEKSELVLAGAGSGKTFTIVGKVKYLVEKRGIKPNEILLLAFNRKAACELNERIAKTGIQTRALTFHKLGLEYVTRSLGRRPDVVDENEMKKIILKYLKSGLSSDTMGTLITFLGLYFMVPRNEEDYDSIGEYYEAMKSTDFESLKGKMQKNLKNKNTILGERVKSTEEVMIANYLYLHGVKYEYERLYPFESQNKFKKPYRPDFYLPDYNLYLEHFGINRNFRAPWIVAPIEERKYLESIQWKREFHKENGTILLETYSYDKKEGNLYNRLDLMLKANNVRYFPPDLSEIYRVVYIQEKDKYLFEFVRLVVTFIQLFKSSGYKSIDDIRRKTREADMNFYDTRQEMFLAIVNDLLKTYNDELKSENRIDFNDMINMATNTVPNDSAQQTYKYVIIDEYQDISVGRYRFALSIVKRTNAKLFCVGDDWQSIYRFTGADIALCTNFANYYGCSELLRIETTHRFSSETIQIVEPFIMTNPQQLKKSMRSHKHCAEPVVLIRYVTDKKVALERAVHEIVEYSGQKTEILLLGRNNRDWNFLLESTGDSAWKIFDNGESPEQLFKYTKFPELTIRFRTVHGAKGDEAENAIILNAEDSLLGFPNQIADDPMLQTVLSVPEKFPNAEERRLFYVALTRSKNKTYLLVPDKNPSIFVRELIRIGIVAIREPINEDTQSHNPICPRCKTGILVLRKREDETCFVGCNLYPQCSNSYNDTNILKHAVKCPACDGYLVKCDGPYGFFLGCSNYPLCTHSEELND